MTSGRSTWGGKGGSYGGELLLALEALSFIALITVYNCIYVLEGS